MINIPLYCSNLDLTQMLRPEHIPALICTCKMMVLLAISSVFRSHFKLCMDTRSSLYLHRQGVIADKEILQQIQHCMFNIQHG